MKLRQITKERLLYTIISLVVSAVIVLPFFIFYSNIRNLLIDREARDARHIAALTATMLENDIERYRPFSELESYEEGAYDKAYYLEMLALFQHLKSNTEASFLYTERLRDGQVQYILDAEIPGSEGFSPLGSYDSLSEDEERAFASGKPVMSGLVHDEKWGNYITGFAPVTDPRDGAVVGLVGVDYSAEHLGGLLHSLRLLIYPIQGVAFLLLFTMFNTMIYSKHKLSNTDPVSGLLNRHGFTSELSNALKRHSRSGQPLCIAMIDIDDFKEVNDTHGHNAGDLVLARLGETIHGCIRKTDISARYGGDEFLILFQDTGLEQAEAVCRRIALKVSESPVVTAENVTLYFAVSIGVSELKKGMTTKDLQEAADRAMYAAKERSRSQKAIRQGQS